MQANQAKNQFHLSKDRMNEERKNTSYFLEMRGISKYFSQVIANDKIDITVKHGEVLGILGENGAGKTTLMNILYGLCEPNHGKISINGQPVTINSPKILTNMSEGSSHEDPSG